MRSNDEPPAEPETPQWPRRLAFAFGVTLAQVVVFAAVFALFWMLAENVVPEHEDDVWAGVEYYLMGLALAPIAAAFTGMIAAALMRLPLFGLYMLPVLLAVLAFLAPVFPGGRNLLLPGLLVFLGGNALIAVASARRPLRPRKPRMSDRGITL